MNNESLKSLWYNEHTIKIQNHPLHHFHLCSCSKNRIKCIFWQKWRHQHKAHLGIIMKVVLAIAFFLAASWMPEIEAMTSCQRGWRLFFKEKMCYKYFPGNRSYYSARKLCKQQGGYKVKKGRILILPNKTTQTKICWGGWQATKT